jgi:hypothetical protein
MKGPLKLINSKSGQMECCICNSQHWASISPGGEYYRGSWQCAKEQCPSNRRQWYTARQRFVKPNWRALL